MPKLRTHPAPEPPKPAPPIREEYEGSRHNQDCQTNLSLEQYDATCLRCTKIKKVIALRRKQTRYGASMEEAAAAYQLAQKIIDDFELTRGETFDKKYHEVSMPPRPRSRTTSAQHTAKVADNFDTI